MKNKKPRAVVLVVFAVALVASAKGQQAFRKGSFQVNLSEGWSSSNYTTTDINTKAMVASGHFEGARDPLSIEYGISSHWGIGLSSGLDIYKIDASSFYGFTTPTNQVKSTSSEFTFDVSYHFLVTPKADISVVSSLGFSNITMKGTVSDYSYNYAATGGILRLGLHGRYFVCKHIGLLAMVSVFSMNNAPHGMQGNTVGNSYATSISGTTLEFGLCFRFKK